MFLSQSLYLSQTLGQRLALSQEQKHTMLLTLVQELQGVQMNTKGTCIYCRYELTKKEMLGGFLDEVEDTTTQCPRCEKRFQPKLYSGNSYSRVELPFYCAKQTLGRLTDEMAELTPDEIAKQVPAVYYSALAHFGTMQAAFKCLGVKYTKDTAKSWRTKALPHLGKYPDAMLASALGVSRASVQKYRSDLGIEAHGH